MNFGRSTPLYRPSHTSSRSFRRLAEILLFVFAKASHTLTIPLTQYYGFTKEDLAAEEEVNLGLCLVIAAVLVLMGGAFAGLTIALMGQDGIYLQVIATSGEGTQQRHAQSVFRLLQKGKHWVLVTLLLSNVIVNETLPIVLDMSLGGGWPAVLGSTVLIVIFGEVIPQSVCVRYGLSIGAFMSPCVLGLMWILAPIAWPIAKLLDILLGKDHGTVYKKSGLKTLVTLHKTLGASPTERLNQDEVTIISAVLDLKDKAVGDIMTPIDDVFTMSEDTILNEETMNIILSAGYSRIPIYEPGNPKNFVGMLLVKILITYDPEDCKRVSEFALATLPETRPETSCLDIVNFFQEGKSHMVLVSEFPAENYGAIGVVTLEDVIEELIGEEIIDESDVYIDVHKAIRRLAPAPKARVQKRQVVSNSDNVNSIKTETNLINLDENIEEPATQLRNDIVQNDSLSVPTHIEIDPKITFLRKGSGGPEGTGHIAIRASSSDMREHLKHLGPSNLASRPKSTRYSAVKIKTAHFPARTNSCGGLGGQPDLVPGDTSRMIIEEEPEIPNSQPYDNLSTPCEDQKSLIRSYTRKETNIPTFAVQNGYGSFDSFTIDRQQTHTIVNNVIDESLVYSTHKDFNSLSCRSNSGRGSGHSSLNSNMAHSSNSRGTSPVKTSQQKKRIVRSGSITENIIEAGGIRKLVLKTARSGELSWHEQSTDTTVATLSMEQRGDQLCNQSVTQNEGCVVGLQNYDTIGIKCHHEEQPTLSQQLSKSLDGSKRKRRKNHYGKKKGPH